MKNRIISHTIPSHPIPFDNEISSSKFKFQVSSSSSKFKFKSGQLPSYFLCVFMIFLEDEGEGEGNYVLS